jgi:hypothetical protein
MAFYLFAGATALFVFFTISLDRYCILYDNGRVTRIAEMATPAQLVKTVSQTLGIPERTVIIHDRNLAKAKLRSVGGRGTGAARMTGRDAAHLLIAAVASREVQGSVEAVKRFGKLPIYGRNWDKATCPSLAALSHPHTFSDALVAMLEADAVAWFAGDHKTHVTVRFEFPNLEAAIDIATRQQEAERTFRMPWDPSGMKPKSSGDLHERYQISEQTIFAIGNLLRGAS